MSIKKIIVGRVIGIYLALFFFALLIIGCVLQLQLVQGDELREQARQRVLRYVKTESNRGDIYAADGKRKLATSVPYFEVRMDLRSDGLTREIFNRKIDSLALCLSRLFGDQSAYAYKSALLGARKRGERFYLIKRMVSYNQLQEMRKFPIFRRGRFDGGFIAIRKNRRVKPHLELASRTIGYLTLGESGNVVGIEGAYDHYLKGITGVRLMQKTAGNLWMPVSDGNEVEPRDGYDVVTTIDVNIQDVAESTLRRQLIKHNAHHGCAVLMEVRTGHIKAIANLEMDEDGTYRELYNYAVGESTEPGSTFKLPALIAAMEEGFVEPEDTVDAGTGKVRYYDKVVRDTKKGGYGKITVQKAFEVSSNVGVSKIIYEHFKGREEKFVDRLYRMHLNEPLQVEIIGEGKPHIKYPGDPYWSGISLAMMAHGYEIRMTPLQILNFYNAVANDGRMVKPMFVKEIRYYGERIKSFRTETIDPSICSSSTIKKVRKMLEGVVERGTAENLRDEDFKIAGKTGTAQVANDKYGYKIGSKVSYQASFVGYFPAGNPRYSCIVVVNSPNSWVYYGNLVAGPVFREIARKVYATSLELHQEVAEIDKGSIADPPYTKHGRLDELCSVLDYFDIPWRNGGPTGNWVITRKEKDAVLIRDLEITETMVPNVEEMGLKDALYLLENRGLRVTVKGRGKVLKQSLPPGTRISPGTPIVLEMSII